MIALKTWMTPSLPLSLSLSLSLSLWLSPSVFSQLGYQAIHHAAVSGHLDIIELLLQNGASLKDATGVRHAKSRERERRRDRESES